MQRSFQNGSTPEKFAEAIASTSWQNSCMPDTREGGSCMQPTVISKTKSPAGSIKTSSSTPLTPQSTSTTHTTNNALAGARFYIDPDLPSDLQSKV